MAIHKEFPKNKFVILDPDIRWFPADEALRQPGGYERLLPPFVPELRKRVKEWRDKKPSSLAITYVAGWLIIFSFWLLYGIRFRAVALWLTNSIAVVLQLALLIAVFSKRGKE